MCLSLDILTIKAPITTAADDIHKYLSIVFQRKLDDVSSESSARRRIQMKNRAIFSEKLRLDVSSESSEDSHEKSSLIFSKR